MNKNTGPVKVLKLKLELKMDEEAREIVKKYGKAKEGISREIIVPFFYPLHALHYAIQKAFGWQNSHLHHFELPGDVFNKLTEDYFVKYCMLCGLLFRFPYSDDEMKDIYWADDYREGKSFKTWLKEKYTAPYSYGGTLEHFMFSQLVAKKFWSEHPTVKISPPFAEYKKGKSKIRDVKLFSATCEEMDRFFEYSFGELVERASIDNVLCTNPEDNACEECTQIAENLDGQFDVYLDELQRVSSIGEKLEAAKAKGERLSKRKNTSSAQLFKTFGEVQALLKEYDNGLDELFNRTDVDMPPVSNELIYKYDYGDDWEVRITCEAEYVGGVESEKAIRFYGTDGTPVDEALSDLMLNKCIVKGNPMCIAADGLPVLDDVGGVSGYCDFLECIKNGEEWERYDDPKESRAWARYMGWTGRMRKPENIL